MKPSSSPSSSSSDICVGPRIFSSIGELPLIEAAALQEKEFPSHMQGDHWIWQRERGNVEAIVAGTSVTFHPSYSFGTSAVRGTKRLTRTTVAYWEVCSMGKLYGTSVMFGIGTDKVTTSLPHCFSDHLGGDSESYGINHISIAQHGGLSVRIAEEPLPPTNCTVGLLFDGPSRTLSYFLNGKFLATPFTNIDTTSKVWYPMVSSTAQRSQFLVQCHYCKSIVPKLTELCIFKTRELLEGISKVDQLPLPGVLKMRIARSNEKAKSGVGRVDRAIVLPENCRLWIREMYKERI